MANARILVADDSPTLQKVVKSVLTQQGYDVVLADDGVEAIRAYYHERPDLVICDILMPKMNGYLVCRLLKEDWSAEATPFIMLTSQDAASDRYRGIKTGATAYLSKDFDASMLVEAVADALEHAEPSDEPDEDDAERAEMSDAEILSRVSDMLDRKLYEATIVNEISTLATKAGDYGDLVSELMGLVASFVDFTMAAIALVEEKSIGIYINKPVAFGDFETMGSHVVENMGAYSAVPVHADEVNTWMIDPDGCMGKGDGEDTLATFVCMPLRTQNQIVALLAVSSPVANAFSEKELTLLRLIEPAVAVVVDNARLYDRTRSD